MQVWKQVSLCRAQYPSEVNQRKHGSRSAWERSAVVVDVVEQNALDGRAVDADRTSLGPAALVALHRVASNRAEAAVVLASTACSGVAPSRTRAVGHGHTSHGQSQCEQISYSLFTQSGQAQVTSKLARGGRPSLRGCHLWALQGVTLATFFGCLLWSSLRFWSNWLSLTPQR